MTLFTPPLPLPMAPVHRQISSFSTLPPGRRTDRSLSYRRNRPQNSTPRHAKEKTRPQPSIPQRNARGVGNGGGSGDGDGGGLGYQQSKRRVAASWDKGNTGKRKDVESESFTC